MGHHTPDVPINIKYDPREPTGNTTYITGPGVGLWKTTDGGLTWLDKSGDIPTLNIRAFALDTANNILYLGTGALTFYFGDGLGMRIFKSTNDGLNWTSISTGIKPGTSISKIAIRVFAKSHGAGTVTPFQAVATALASTVGDGNIVGVSTAITNGGPGALFWLIVSGLIGMGTKLAEVVLAITYREQDDQGTWRGGAMYILKSGLKAPWLGTVFALLTALAAFGIGNMVQANSVAESVKVTFGVPAPVSGIVIVVLTGIVILGAITRIADVTQLLVPFMCLSYLLGAAVILVDDVIGIEDGNVRTLKRVSLAHFAVNEDGTRIDYDVAFQLVGKLTIRQLKETAQALIGIAEDDLVPKESSGG